MQLRKNSTASRFSVQRRSDCDAEGEVRLQKMEPGNGNAWADDVAGRASPDMIMAVSELAVYLRVHSTTIYRLLKENGVPAFRVGSDWRFSRRAIDRWMLKSTKAIICVPLKTNTVATQCSEEVSPRHWHAERLSNALDIATDSVRA